MTQEEKAKAYEMALEKARKRVEIEPQDHTDKILKDIFPELRESEDERIRKFILEVIKTYDGMSNSTKEKCLAYLEKQKEAGIQWFKSDNVKNPDKPYIDKAGMFYTTDGRMCYASEIEKQKEQNSAEWSKEDVARLKEKIDAFNESVKDWLNFCCPRPKQKWSEEDEKNLENIRIYLLHHGEDTWAGTITKLKSLQFQPQHRDTYYDIIHNILAMLEDIDFMQITPEHRVSLLNDIRVRCKHADEWAEILD